MYKKPNNSRRGFSLVEVLVATALALILVGITVNLFALVTESIADTRAAIETTNRLRAAQLRLQEDLRCITLKPNPPHDPNDQEGFLEIIEGPGPFSVTGRGIQPLNTDVVSGAPTTDTTVGDTDDIILFTSRSFGEPFTGLYAGNSSQSQVAEIAWFLRGTTLHRRVLLVLPQAAQVSDGTGRYANYDLSMHQEGGSKDDHLNPGPARLVPNSLGDLTKREHRFAHQPWLFPHNARFWYPLGLPTREESSISSFTYPYNTEDHTDYVGYGNFTGNASPTVPAIDYWVNGYQWLAVDGTALPASDQWIDTSTGQINSGGTRIAQDVILTNVLGFDVKVWDDDAPSFLSSGGEVVGPGDSDYRTLASQWTADPSTVTIVGRGAFVDLFYMRGQAASAYNASSFAGPGNAKSRLNAGVDQAAVYDTWSTHYEYDGIDQDNRDGDDDLTTGADEASDGLDNDDARGVDDENERETSAPYPVPLKAVQISIRVFEPDTGQIREVTVVQDF